MSNDYDDVGGEQEPDERPRDRMVDAAKDELLTQFFPADGKEVYYGRQLEVWLEKKYFHWITKKALNELAAQRMIGLEVASSGDVKAHFYFPLRHRYPRRQIREILGLISEFAAPKLTRAVGKHGELLFDAGMAHLGFRIVQTNVKEFGEKRWTDSNHDLDRLIERDGICYGVEIKNQLGYIDQTEFETKLRMCGHLGVRPLFVARMMPKNYINDVVRAGGFSLILGDQHYPLMADDLARRVKARLRFPISVIGALPNGDLQRFGKWHDGLLKRSEGR